MFELYEHRRGTTFVDNYMVIIDNPDKNLEGHQPYYDITITQEGDILHGEQWSQKEVDTLRERVQNKSSVFTRTKLDTTPTQVALAIDREMENEL